MFVQDQYTMSLSPSLIDYIDLYPKNNGEQKEKKTKKQQSVIRSKR
jgi:hypothetical protein